jgi:thiol-disulfide isomerase/thioredoxin
MILAVLVAAVAASCSTGGGVASSAGFSFVSPGGQTELSYDGADRQPISAISGPDLINSNATVSLADYPGKVVVLNFWGSWCAPCRAEAQGLANASTTFASRGVQFVGVDIKDTREGGADFHTFKKVPYPSIFDPSMRTLLSLRGYPATAIPSTIVLDRSHRVSHIYLLPVTETQLAAAITPLLNEKP